MIIRYTLPVYDDESRLLKAGGTLTDWDVYYPVGDLRAGEAFAEVEDLAEPSDDYEDYLYDFEQGVLTKPEKLPTLEERVKALERDKIL